MATGFEDEFTDKQTEIIAMCMEAVDGNADKVYAYGSIEKTSRMFNVFYLVNGKTQMLNAFGVPGDRIFQYLRLGMEILEEMKEICERHDRPVPTELRMIYDNKTGEYDGYFQYEPIWTEESDISITPNSIFRDWREEIEAQLSN